FVLRGGRTIRYAGRFRGARLRWCDGRFERGNGEGRLGDGRGGNRQGLVVQREIVLRAGGRLAGLDTDREPEHDDDDRGGDRVVRFPQLFEQRACSGGGSGRWLWHDSTLSRHISPNTTQIPYSIGAVLPNKRERLSGVVRARPGMHHEPAAALTKGRGGCGAYAWRHA